jgi:hypothetical protein
MVQFGRKLIQRMKKFKELWLEFRLIKMKYKRLSDQVVEKCLNCLSRKQIQLLKKWLRRIYCYHTANRKVESFEVGS